MKISRMHQVVFSASVALVLISSAVSWHFLGRGRRVRPVAAVGLEVARAPKTLEIQPPVRQPEAAPKAREPKADAWWKSPASKTAPGYSANSPIKAGGSSTIKAIPELPSSEETYALFSSRADSFFTSRRWDEAKENLDAAMKIVVEDHLNMDNLRWADAYIKLSIIEYYQGHYRKASELADKSFAAWNTRERKFDIFTAEHYNSVANVYMWLGRFADAEEILRRSLAFYEAKFSHDSLALAEPLSLLGETYSWQGRYDKAELLLRRAVALYPPERPASKGKETQAAAMYALGACLRHEGKLAEAKDILKQVVDIGLLQLDGSDECMMAPKFLCEKADVERDCGELEQAENDYAESESIEMKSLGETPRLAQTLSEHSILLRKCNRPADAQAAEDRAAKIRLKAWQK